MPNSIGSFNTAHGRLKPTDLPTAPETDPEDLGAEPLEGSGFEDEGPETEFEEER